MGMLEELAQYLEDQGVGVYSPGDGETRDIFISHRPDTPSACSVLYEAPGRPRSFLGYTFPELHVEVRGASYDYSGPRAVIESIITALHGIMNQDIGDTRYQVIQARQEPFPLPMDDSHRPVLAVNFRVEKDS